MYELMTVHELSGLIQKKKAKPSEICADFLARAETTEDRIHAYITLDGEKLMEAAQKCDELQNKDDLPPLFGLPIAIKDNICTQGMLTTCASRILYNFRPPYDATVVSRLKSQGAIIMGKTNMDEFAMGSSCETSFFGVTRNPHDTTKVPGGSSGGSAAAVAAGSAPMALGSDTGGSVRLPASFCGTVGFKPSYGAVSRYGLIAYASSLDQIGPITRTVEDAAILTQIICGFDNMDSTSKKGFIPDFDMAAGTDVKGKKIGIPKEYFAEGISGDTREAVMRAAECYVSLGAELVDISLPLIGYSLPVYYILASAEASSNLARYDGVKYGYRSERYEGLTDLYVRSRTEGFGEEVKRRIMLGTYVLSSGYYDAYYKRARIVQTMLKEEFRTAFEKCDVILTPVTPAAAFGVGEKMSDPVEMYLTDICTVSVNIAGLPAVSIPCGYDKAGLPIGMQLIGRQFDDANLLRTGRAFERENGFSNRVAEVK